MDDPRIDYVTEVQLRHMDELMTKANVVGVAIGMVERATGPAELGIVVMVTHKVAESELAPQDRIPAELEGVPVDVREMGRFVAQ